MTVIQTRMAVAALMLAWAAVGPAAAAPDAAASDRALQRLKLENNLRLQASTEAAARASDETEAATGEGAGTESADAVTPSAPALPSLADLVQLAEDYDPAYRAAQAGLAGSREFKTIGRASILPTLQASGSRTRNRQDRDIQQGAQSIEDRRYYDATSASLQLRQPLYAPETRARYREALSLVDEAEVTFSDEHARMVIRVVEAYLEMVLASSQVDVLARDRDDVEALLASAERRQKQGEATRVEVLDLRARLQRAEVQARSAENTRRSSVHRLASLAGGIEQRPFDQLSDAGGRLQLSRGTIEGWLQVARHSSTRRLLASAEIEQAEAAVARARGARLPRVDALANFTYNDSDTVNTVGQTFETSSVGVQVSVPIFNSGSGSASLRQAEAFLERARAQYEAVDLELEQSIRTAYDQFVNIVDAERSLLLVQASAEAAADAAERGFAAGILTSLDVLNAKALERDVALEALSARYESARAFVVLHELAGQVDAELIRTLSTAFSGS